MLYKVSIWQKKRRLGPQAAVLPRSESLFEWDWVVGAAAPEITIEKIKIGLVELFDGLAGIQEPALSEQEAEGRRGVPEIRQSHMSRAFDEDIIGCIAVILQNGVILRILRRGF